MPDVLEARRGSFCKGRHVGDLDLSGVGQSVSGGGGHLVLRQNERERESTFSNLM